MAKCGIYTIKNVKTGRVYVGQSSHIAQRWRTERSLLRRNKLNNAHLQSSWNKHGEGSFAFEIVQECAVEFLTAYEQSYLDYYRHQVDGVYNQVGPADAPTRGRVFSEEERAKVRGRPSPLKGKKTGKPGPNKDRVWSDETKKKMSDSAKKRDQAAAGMSGKSHTEESRIKNSRSKGGRPIRGVDLKTGEVREYEWLSAVSMDGFSFKSVSAALHGKLKSHHGWGWEYADVD